MWTIYCWFVLYTLGTKSMKVYCYFRVLDGDPYNPPCILASPNMTYFVNRTELVIGSNLLQDGEKVWTGYTKIQKAFRYIGCISYEDADSHEETIYEEISTVLDIGICYLVCSDLQMPVFGMQGGVDKPCICFRGEIKEQEAKSRNCNAKCTNSGFRCGELRYISLYENVVQEVKAEISDTKRDKCLSTNKAKYYWKECDEKIGTLCQKGLSSKETEYEGRKSSWLQSSTVCFLKGMYPMNYRRDVPYSYWNHFWTAVFQTTVVRRVSKWHSKRDTMFGYVERNGDAYILKFTSDRYVTSKVLCLKEFEDSPAVTDGSTTSVSTQRSEDTTITRSSKESNYSEIDQIPLSDMKGNGNLNRVAFYVGVPAGILLVIGGIVIIILIRKRRKQNPSTAQSKKHAGENGAVCSLQEGMPLNVENEYDLYNDEERGIADQYQVVEYEDNSDNTTNDFDVYEIPNEETAYVDHEGETREDQYDIYEVTDQNEDYVNSGAVERDNIVSKDYMHETANAPSSNYFVLEKKRSQMDNDIGRKSDGQTSRAYNHVQVSSKLNSEDGNVDEYDHIVHVSGPTANRKDYNTTSINRDKCDTYDTASHVLVKPHEKHTDNIYSKSFRN